MFGNRLGWGISAVLAMGLFGLVVVLGRLNTVSKPSVGPIDRQGKYTLNLTTNAEMMAPFDLPFDLKAVVPSATKAQDAAPLYRQAIADAQADRQRYDPERKIVSKTATLADYPALQAVVEARDCNAMQLFAAKPEEVLLTYSLIPEPLGQVLRIGRKTLGLAVWEADYDKDEAIKLAEAAVSLGYKLCQERLRFYEYEGGSTLVAEGCLLLAKLDPSRAPAAKAASAAMSALMKSRGMPFQLAFSSVDPAVMDRTAGDMFYLADKAPERMLRIEALLKLGQYKFNVGESGNAADQRGATITTRRKMNDRAEDPAVRLAAKLAYEMTHEDYSRIGGK